MRPALQRLVSRPSSRELLRLLVGHDRAIGFLAPAASDTGRRQKRSIRLRKYSGVAVAPNESDLEIQEAGNEITNGSTNADLQQVCSSNARKHKHTGLRKDMISTATACSKRASRATELGTVSSADKASSISKPPGARLMERKRTQWKESMFSRTRLDFESDFDASPIASQPRLLDTRLENDASLWIMLLSYRKRIDGMQGVRSFWEAIQERNLQLPREKHLADKLWRNFLALGFKDLDVLESIYQYAKRMKEQHDLSWSTLYPDIVGHFFESNQGGLALKWHNRLSKLQQPGLGVFSDMCRRVISKNGDLGVLKQIYNLQPHRNVYASIVPLLCRSEQYNLALEWHTFLYKKGDTPEVATAAQPLVAYYSIYNPHIARKVTSDLVAANSSFASTLTQNLEEHAKISREMMNNIHGKTFDIPAKKYSDELGARWFATTWVSLDVAINAIHALGMQEIGPLSLQAIALRAPDPKAIVARIKQLETLGISIGDSIFSRAIENFARDEKSDLLAALLDSDEHPDEFQNVELQEALLVSYAQTANWTLYRMTLAIRILASQYPEINRRNIELRTVASINPRSSMNRDLESMLMDAVPITKRTITILLEKTLGHRRIGRRPVSLKPVDGWIEKRALSEGIQMMQAIMKSGTRVNVRYWHEIIRRIGMRGDMSSLRSLCSWLAKVYGPQNHDSTEGWLERYRVPLDVKTSHESHPLRKMFPASLQKAIVEWGFIASQPYQVPRHTHPSSVAEQTTIRTLTTASRESPASLSSGISILQNLNSLGVHIDGPSVRKAIFNRLITYYGPGYSNRRYNKGKMRSIGSLEDVAKEIDTALGGEYFTSVELRDVVNKMAITRWERREKRVRRRAERRPELRVRDPRWSFLLQSRKPMVLKLVERDRLEKSE
ncbi:uncharacterized protein RAG0_06293 [Rhynchosporium agropyri]|uniref:Pentatricopeptide repeat domain-containing protein n=1 Tax=Rhynchosporium agropyri TaxID=914238 RepID=A0A1E1KGG7_9HELO|nr:uncharacterized protein RAG0_06293 [Rhynchosporium agropyri]